LFNFLLKPSPDDYKLQNFGEETFCIETPYQQDKDPFFYNYISPASNAILVRHITKAFHFFFHEKMMEYRNKGLLYKDCVQLFLDDYQIDAAYYDRCIKDMQRWRNNIAVKKNNKKKHRVNSSFCPAD
jgi:hypothetical protein